jgi:hypothetical protein
MTICETETVTRHRWTPAFRDPMEGDKCPHCECGTIVVAQQAYRHLPGTRGPWYECDECGYHVYNVSNRHAKKKRGVGGDPETRERGSCKGNVRSRHPEFFAPFAAYKCFGSGCMSANTTFRLDGVEKSWKDAIAAGWIGNTPIIDGGSNGFVGVLYRRLVQLTPGVEIRTIVSATPGRRSDSGWHAMRDPRFVPGP